MAGEERDRQEFTFEMEWLDHLAFNVEWDFREAPDLLMDEPPAAGGSGRGPNAARMVVAGVAICLTASLLFCLEKSRVKVEDLRVRCHGTLERNEGGRLRLTSIRLEPLVRMEDGKRRRLDHCMRIFEDFCVVTEAVRNGIPVDIQVHLVDAEGNETPVEPEER